MRDEHKGEPLPRLPRTAPIAAKSPAPTKTGPQTVPFQNSRSAIVVVVGIVCAGVGFLFIQWYADQVITLNKHAERAGDARRKTHDGFMPKPTAKFKVAPPRLAASVADGRARAPATMRVEDMVVGVMAAKLGPIQVKDDRSIPGEFLTLKLRITNLSKRPFDYKSWSQRKAGIILCDQNKNYYNRVMIEDPPIVAQTLQPGDTIVDMIAFEPPLKFFGYLDLDLPSHTYVPYVFQIPGGFVEKVELPKPPPVQVAAPRLPTPPPPPVQPTYDPELDFKLKAQVISEYREGRGSIERKINGMSFDRGRKFRPIAVEKLYNEIAESHNLTVEQVKRMIK